MPRLRRALGHVGLAVLSAVIVLGALPPNDVVDVDEPVTTISRMTNLGMAWPMFAPDVGRTTNWTDVTTRDAAGSTTTVRLEDRRHEVLGLRGVRHHKLAATARRSCIVAEGLARAELERAGATEVVLTRLTERRARHQTRVERDREVLLRAETRDGEVVVERHGCRS